jgi:hypothetical protein
VPVWVFEESALNERWQCVREQAKGEDESLPVWCSDHAMAPDGPLVTKVGARTSLSPWRGMGV